MPVGALRMNSADSVTTPSVVIEAILFALNSVKSRLFSLPGRMMVGVARRGEDRDVERRSDSRDLGTKALAIQSCHRAPPRSSPENRPQ